MFAALYGFVSMSICVCVCVSVCAYYSDVYYYSLPCMIYIQFSYCLTCCGSRGTKTGAAVGIAIMWAYKIT